MKIYLFSLYFLLASFSLSAQKKDQIRILNANELVYIDDPNMKAQRLIGDVRFKHHDALMYCDSAYFYSNKNKLTAFSNVEIHQGDSTTIYGDRMDYDGNSGKAIVSGKIVRMVNEDFVLTTDELVFDRKKNTTSYHTGGKIVSKTDNNVLESRVGYYFTDLKKFFFSKKVKLNNETYLMKTDSMTYHTTRKIVGFFGPSTIEGEGNFIYCEDGYYNTETEISEYNKNAFLISDGRKLEGNSLYYDRKKGFGKAIGNVQVTDTVEGIIINGERAWLYEEPDSVTVTGNALLTQVFEQDSLYLHGDTFKIVSDQNGNRLMKAYHGVRIFKTDLQGSCDSLVYSFADSTIDMFSKPILWSQQNQLTAEKIQIRTKNGNMHSIFMDNNAFIISEVDPNKYNQIKGLKMTGIFKDNELHQINVNGNGETIYYGQDDNGKFIGVNKAEAANLEISILSNKVSQILFLGSPNAVMYPIGELGAEDLKYEGFEWLIEKKPKTKEDVFTNTRITQIRKKK